MKHYNSLRQPLLDIVLRKIRHFFSTVWALTKISNVRTNLEFEVVRDARTHTHTQHLTARQELKTVDKQNGIILMLLFTLRESGANDAK